MLKPDVLFELKTSKKLPSPQGVALKVIELCKRDNISLPDLLRAIVVDPSATGRILKLANSAAYARRRPVASLSADVLMSLGIDTIRQVVLAFSLIDNYRHGACTQFDYKQFWSWSLAIGVAAQLIGSGTRIAPPAELFTLGLLANVGRLGLAELYPEQYGTLIQNSGGFMSNLQSETEQTAFGFTHIDISVALINEWGLPKLFCDAVNLFETPLPDTDEPDRLIKLALALDLARQLADLYTINNAAEKPNQAMYTQAQRIGIEEYYLDAIPDALKSEWQNWNKQLLGGTN